MKESVATLLLAAVLVLFVAGTPVYFPTDDITVNCGFSRNRTRQGDSRNWIGDADNLKYAPKSADSDDRKILSVNPLQGSPMVPDPVPYYSARLSTSPFTYTFHLTPGPKFVRLYFYPTDYPGQNFTRTGAMFSVKAGAYALLKDFNTSLAADYLYDTPSFNNEFVICVDENQVLNLTFTPSAVVPGSYAFVNGIEVVSMPNELYYTKTDASPGIPLMGQSNPYVIDNYDALQMVKRVNVGGTSISPGDDTGMYRSWEPDERYLVVTDMTTDKGVAPEGSTIQLIYSSQTPNYTAPDKVYKTARSMGSDASTNMRYNLTWSFEVDSNFYYLVRLHFCEFLSNIARPLDRVFQIYIDSKTAESRADIVKWSGKGVPVYRDYAVAMFDHQSKRMNLSIALHPNGDGVTVYSDAILNGIEIFKINNTGGSLAGSNPDPSSGQGTVPPIPGMNPSSGSDRRRIVAGIIAGGISCLLIISLLVLFTYRRRKVGKGTRASDGVTSLWGPLSYDDVTKSSTNTRGSSLPDNLCRHFSLPEIKTATNNFDEIFIVGVGGFGNVYKGYIDGGSTQVAIKRLNPGSQQGVHEFMTEIEMLSQLRHLHLVSLIGYCNDSGEMILVYDYMARGTLREHLYNTDNPPLSWKRRLEICIGAARGLQYLHTGAKQAVIHRDMKTTNILLDEKWVAKVSDFGLSKFGPTGMSKAHVSTVVKGTFGYLDPEYYRRQQLTDKSDVYSFGVVLFEVLCARQPVNRSAEKKQINLAAWAQICYKSGNIQRIVDPKVKGEITPECLRKFCEIAISCLNDEGPNRPSMNDVVWGLEFALQLQESLEKEGAYLGKPDGSDNSDEECPIMGSSSDGMISSSDTKSSKMTMSSSTEFRGSSKSYDSQNMLSGAVFSELLNPNGR